MDELLIFTTYISAESDRIAAALEEAGISVIRREKGTGQYLFPFMGMDAKHPVEIYVTEKAGKRAGKILKGLGLTPGGENQPILLTGNFWVSSDP